MGSSKDKYSWQALIISMLLVFDSFIKSGLFIAKPREAFWDLVSAQASMPHINTRKYWILIGC